MKKLILIIALTVLNASAYACTCGGPNFTEKDTEQAILNFMKSKIGVEESEIVSVETIDQHNFLSFKAKTLLVALKPFGDSNMNSCNRDCASMMSEVSTNIVEYRTLGKTCQVELKVKMKSNLFNTQGFKSVVAQKNNSTCL